MKIPRWLKITVGVLLGISATLLVTLTALLIWIVNNPYDAYRVVDKYFFPEDLEITWEDVDFVPQKEHWRSWQIEFDVRKLRITKTSPEIDILIESIRLDVGLQAWMGERWFAFRAAEVLGGEPMRMKLGPSEKREGEVEQSPYQMARGYLDYLTSANRLATVDSLKISIPSLRIESSAGGEPMLIALDLSKPTEGLGAKSGIVGVRAGLKQAAIELVLDGPLDTALLGHESEPFFRGTLKVIAGGVKAESAVLLSDNGKKISLEGDGKVEVKQEKKPMRLKPGFALTLQESAIDFNLQSNAVDIPGPIVKLDKVQAVAKVPLENDRMWSENAATFRVWTFAELFFVDRDMRPPLEKACRCKIPERLEVSVAGRAWMRPALEHTSKREPAVDAKFKIESVDNKLFTADIGAGLLISRERDEFVYEPQLDSIMIVHSYQGLRTFLDAKGVMIPAPFDVLEGTLRLDAKAPVERANGRVKSVAKVGVNLSSTNQTVQLETDVTLDLDTRLKGLDVYVSALIKAFQVELPPLDPIRGLPPLARDSRVLLKPPPKKSKTSFKSRVFLEMKTESIGAIRLLSGLAKPHVPITMNVKAASRGDPSGFVRIEPFTLSYLRRNVAVEKLQISLGANEDAEMPIEGRFRIDQTAYKVFISVAGTLESPNVQLSSEPYLPRSEIISVLLYDRTSSELVSADAETVGSFEAALADRAIGLFGLWAFATTPIKSFSYNAVTKVYSATVQLGEGLTAGVGTNWEQAAHLEVRKRVSRRWVLTASWSPSEDREQVGKLVLQWEKRF